MVSYGQGITYNLDAALGRMMWLSGKDDELQTIGEFLFLARLEPGRCIYLDLNLDKIK